MYFSRNFCALLGVAGLLVLPGCGKKSATPPSKPARAVSVAQASLKDVPLYLDEIGNCTAYEAVVVQPQVSGALTGIHFQDGAEIRKGDRLFTIDPRSCQAALDKAKATLEADRAKAAYAQAQVQRNEALNKTKIIAVQDYDSLVSTAQAAQATVQADQAAVDEASLNLEYCEIRSPIDGRAGKRKVDIGNIVSANATQLLSVQRQDPIYADFTIPERALADVRAYRDKGTLQVDVRFADAPAKHRVGSFDFLDNGVQQASGTVRVRALLDNKDRLFWPGQFVNVRLLLDVLPQAVIVPAEAVQVGQGGPFVFVVKADATVELRKIQTGQRQEENLVVTKGLAAGETVVVTGQVSLSPGASVKVVPSEK